MIPFLQPRQASIAPRSVTYVETVIYRDSTRSCYTSVHTTLLIDTLPIIFSRSAKIVLGDGVYRTSTFRPAQSSRSRASTSLSKSFARFTATLSSLNSSSGAVGTPPAFCRTQISRCAFKAMLSEPALNLCSSSEGSTTGRVVGSGKNANVMQNGV